MGKRLSIRGGVRNPNNKKPVKSTRGKDKGETCQTSPKKKFLLTHAHAHRLEPVAYAEMHEWAKNANK